MRDPHQVRQLIGLTGQYASVDEKLSGTNNLFMIGRLLGLPARAPGPGRTSCWSGSSSPKRPGGPRRPTRAACAAASTWPRAWSAGRAVLYLDEPTTGLDPHSRNEVWDDVRRLVADGTTVLLTTQYLEEADQLAHDITVIDHGKVIATGTPDELKARVGGRSSR